MELWFKHVRALELLIEDDFALSDGESSDNVGAGMRCSLKTTSPSLMARAVTMLVLGCGAL